MRSTQRSSAQSRRSTGYTVRITTPKPSVLLPYRLAAANTGILSPAAYEGEQVNPIEAGTGPFVLKEIVPKQRLKMVRNESYWAGPVGGR